MSDIAYLDWPFFEPRHAELQRALDAWAAKHVAHGAHHDVDAECRALVSALGRGGWLRHAVAGTVHGGAGETLDTRALCLIRETLARHAGLADFAFAMQGLGSGAISLQGSAAQKAAIRASTQSGIGTRSRGERPLKAGYTRNARKMPIARCSERASVSLMMPMPSAKGRGLA